MSFRSCLFERTKFGGWESWKINYLATGAQEAQLESWESFHYYLISFEAPLWLFLCACFSTKVLTTLLSYNQSGWKMANCEKCLQQPTQCVNVNLGLQFKGCHKMQHPIWCDDINCGFLFYSFKQSHEKYFARVPTLNHQVIVYPRRIF